MMEESRVGGINIVKEDYCMEALTNELIEGQSKN